MKTLHEIIQALRRKVRHPLDVAIERCNELRALKFELAKSIHERELTLNAERSNDFTEISISTKTKQELSKLKDKLASASEELDIIERKNPR